MCDEKVDLERFYALISQLEAHDQQGLMLSEYNGRSRFPTRGVYFFREPGEYRLTASNTRRIVRVGTHAVSANSQSTLWNRLRTHLGTRTGGGNHRGSIFRLHVGAAMLARDGLTIPTWGVGSSAPPELRACTMSQVAEATHERKVSEYIGAMSVLWIDIPDDPGPDSIRAYIEQNSIALLSNRFTPFDPASSGWLGRSSPKNSIILSGLWNMKHVDQAYNPQFLDFLEKAVERTIKSC